MHPQEGELLLPGGVPEADMMEAYKTKAPQEKTAQPRESAREKLDALAKETAAKVAPEKPKAKTKSKKGVA